MAKSVAKQLCVQGSPEQILAHSELDAIERKAELRKLHSDDPRVVAARSVCDTCVFVEDCTNLIQDHIEGSEVILPRPVTKAGVFGKGLFVHMDWPSLELIDLDETGLFEHTYENARVAFNVDGDPNFGEDIAAKTVYDFVLHNSKPEGFADFLREIRKTIEEEIKQYPTRKQQQKGKKHYNGNVQQDRGYRSATLQRLIRAIRDLPQGDKEQIQRDTLMCGYLNGKFSVGDLTGNKLDDYDKAKSAIITHNNQLVKKHKQTVESEGACKDDPEWAHHKAENGQIKQQRNICLGCTAFASCGVVTLLDSGIKGVRVTISTRNLPKLRTGVSKRTIHKVQEDPDFPVLAASYANYFSQFQKELIKQPFSEGRQAKGQRTHGSFVDGLVKNLKGATTAFIEK